MRSLTLIDFKSSNAIYPEYITQVACYSYMAIYDLTLPGPVTNVGILRLDKETGIPEYVDCTSGLEEQWKAFQGLREYYRWIVEPEAKKDRYYKYEDRLFPSVTTILGILQKPALPQWAANMTIDYIRENLKEMDTDEKAEYHLKKAKTAFRTMSKKAMDTGSIVHDAIEAFLSGAKPDDILKGNDKAETAFLAFLEWKDSVKLEVVATERALIHPHVEVGGTCDLIAWLGE